MKIVLQCWSSHDDTCGCDYALVDLTCKLARHLLDRLAAFRRFRKDTGAHEACWFDSIADFFSPWGDASGADQQPNARETKRVEKALSALTDKDLIEVADDFEIPDRMEARTECDRTVAREDGIHLSCFPKHTDLHITTGTIPVAMLERAAALTESGQRGTPRRG